MSETNTELQNVMPGEMLDKNINMGELVAGLQIIPTTEKQDYEVKATYPKIEQNTEYDDMALTEISNRVDDMIMKEIVWAHQNSSHTWAINRGIMLDKIKQHTMEIKTGGSVNDNTWSTTEVYPVLPENTIYTNGPTNTTDDTQLAYIRGQLYWSTADTVASWQFWDVGSSSNINDHSIGLCGEANIRNSQYDLNHIDLSNMFRMANAGLAGNASHMFIRSFQYNNTSQWKLSVDSVWLKWHLYNNWWNAITYTGGTVENLMIVDPIRNHRTLRHATATVDEIYTAITMPDQAVINYRRLGAGYASFTWFTNWLVYGIGQITMTAGGVQHVFTKSDIGKSLYLIPVSDVSMTMEEICGLVFTHTPYPAMPPPSSDQCVAYTFTGNMMTAGYVPIASKVRVRDDASWKLAGGVYAAAVIFVHQPNVTPVTTLAGIPITTTGDVDIIYNMGQQIWNNWNYLSDSWSTVASHLSTSYNQGKSFKDMFELSVALCNTQPLPKVHETNGVTALGNQKEVMGTPCIPPAGGIPPHRYDMTAASIFYSDMPNLLGLFPITTRANQFPDRPHLNINNFDNILALALAFGFYDWMEPGYKAMYNYQPTQLGLANLGVATKLALRLQLAIGEMPYGALYNPLVLSTQLQTIRSELVNGDMKSADGSVRARLVSMYNNSFTYRIVPDQECFTWYYLNQAVRDIDGWRWIPWVCDMFEYMNLMKANEIQTKPIKVQEELGEISTYVEGQYTAIIFKDWPKITDYKEFNKVTKWWWNNTFEDTFAVSLRKIASYDSREVTYSVTTQTMPIFNSSKASYVLYLAGKQYGLLPYPTVARAIGYPLALPPFSPTRVTRERLVWKGERNNPTYLSSSSASLATGLELVDQPITRTELDLLQYKRNVK